MRQTLTGREQRTTTTEQRAKCQSGLVDPGFRPVRLVEIELAAPLASIPTTDPASGQRYPQARALVRLHSRPVGLVPLALPDTGLSPTVLAQYLWTALGHQLAAHLRADSLPVPDTLPPTGLAAPPDPPCNNPRRRALARSAAATVVVCTRDRPEQLEACLRSLRALDYPAFEVLVVDNAPSTPATASLVRRIAMADPRVRYVREDCPGLSSARNRGLAAAEGEIVAFTDDDVLVDRYWLAELAAGFTISEAVACVTGLVLPLELETPAQVWFEEYGGHGKGFERRVFDLTEHRPSSPLYPYNAGTFGSGDNMAFRVTALRRIGGFDPALSVGTEARGGEDLAAFFKVIRSGHRLLYEPGAIVWHQHRRDYAGLRRQLYGYGVGLTAYLTKILLDDPRLVFDILPRVPHGLWHALSPGSPKNRGKQRNFPKKLSRIELRGMSYGPIAYLRGHFR